jgi:exodeoxyribonuclease VIII
VRPDLEIDIDAVRIGADLKTISMWNVKQESLRADCTGKSSTAITT